MSHNISTNNIEQMHSDNIPLGGLIAAREVFEDYFGWDGGGN
jgi:hypothetical protein